VGSFRERKIAGETELHGLNDYEIARSIKELIFRN
jgi:hypothetical protein